MRPVSVCPVCVASVEHAPVACERAGDVLRWCRSCGSLFADPQFEPSELLAIYDEDFYSEERTARNGLPKWGDAAPPLIYETYARVLLSRYPRLGRGGARVLDYGCGLGQFLVAMERRGGRVPRHRALRGRRPARPGDYGDRRPHRRRRRARGTGRRDVRPSRALQRPRARVRPPAARGTRPPEARAGGRPLRGRPERALA